MGSNQTQTDLPDGSQQKKRPWWHWGLGLLLLLAVCDDDDDGPRKYCYDFLNGENLCFDEPLPKDQHCYLTDGKVRCFDKPQ